MLTLRGWFCVETHGNMFQSGLPDIYATHYTHGARWIEVKIKEKHEFTDRQTEVFPKLRAHGTRIWILTAATEDEYNKLFKQDNLFEFMMAKL